MTEFEKRMVDTYAPWVSRCWASLTTTSGRQIAMTASQCLRISDSASKPMFYVLQVAIDATDGLVPKQRVDDRS